jgi:hypothetical protein
MRAATLTQRALAGSMVAMTQHRTLTSTHWGVYEVEYDEAGKAIRLHPFSKDPGRDICAGTLLELLSL